MTRKAARLPSQRQLRVGEEVRHALAMVLERGDLRDPVLQGISITVTEVRMSPDLRNASVFLMPLGGGDGETVVAALARARRFLRRQVAERVHLKYTPDLEFLADGSFDEASHIARLLASPTVAGDTLPHDGEDEDRGA